MATVTEPGRTLPTTVFVVDDDPFVLRRVTKKLLQSTNLGVLTADSIPRAVEYLDGRFLIGAVLVDLNFRKETQDHQRHLYDGLGLVKYIQAKWPDLPVYVYSIDAGDRAVRRQAEEMGLRVKGWYDKLESLPVDQYKPWERIERDLIVEALKSEPNFRREARAAGQDPADLLTDEGLAKKVRTIFNYPRLTYLQYLPGDYQYQFRNPIEVHCWPSDEDFHAKAIQIPLLAEASGEDPVEAIENLADQLVEEKGKLDSMNRHLLGYAKFISERLSHYLEPIAPVDNEHQISG